MESFRKVNGQKVNVHVTGQNLAIILLNFKKKLLDSHRIKRILPLFFFFVTTENWLFFTDLLPFRHSPEIKLAWLSFKLQVQKSDCFIRKLVLLYKCRIKYFDVTRNGEATFVETFIDILITSFNSYQYQIVFTRKVQE